ncbi:MAG: hypothetical protein CTY12_09110 [Methylotenera sp.]|nr:MAG: hypothetical protein CK423_10010 [Legionella sp.]PPD50882.1 MAG: hypothetical protein CTY12_09110 [Methylotenera sp.]
MRSNKKYFLAVLTAFGIQVALGVNSAYAYCENEITNQCRHSEQGRPDQYPTCIATLQKITNEDIAHYAAGVDRKEELQEAINKGQKYIRDNANAKDQSQTKYNVLSRARNVCIYQASISKIGETSNNSNSQVSQSDNRTSNAESTNGSSQNQPSQQNSTPEDVERSNVRNYSAQRSAAYEQKYQGRGKKHNLDAAANSCIKTKGRKVLNTCDFDIEVVFCAENPDPNSKHAFEMANGFDCARDSKGMWGISANSALMGVFTAESVSVFACKKPSLPGAEYDHQKKTLVGRCSEY